ncbi:MAG: hypothetical protein CMM47_05435 [Rhodospirillaceae bacterium]|nr:hypothetical protein [Rhodospirillaceae bacterium]
MEAVELDLQYVKQTFSRVMDQYTRPTKMRHFAWRILQNVSNLNMRQQNEITANKDQRFNKFYHRPLLEGCPFLHRFLCYRP